MVARESSSSRTAAAAAFGTPAGAAGIAPGAGGWAPGSGRTGAAGICGRTLVLAAGSWLPRPFGWVIWLSSGTNWPPRPSGRFAASIGKGTVSLTLRTPREQVIITATVPDSDLAQAKETDAQEVREGAEEYAADRC